MIKLIIHIFSLLILISPLLSAKLYKFEYQKDIQISYSAELEITNKIGSIEITGGNSGQIIIRAVKYVSAENQSDAERLAEYIDIDSHRSGDKISINTTHKIPPNKTKTFWEKLFGDKEKPFGSVDFRISTPSDCKIMIDCKKGRVSISDVSERILIISLGGDIEMSNIVGNSDIRARGKINIANHLGDLVLVTAGDDIAINELTGRVDIESTAGNKLLSDIKGNLTITQSSGDITLTGMNGDLRIKSSSGEINIDQISGGLNLLGNRSNVNIDSHLGSDTDYFVETSSGNIRFSIPEGLSGSALINTISGEIGADLQLLVKTLTKTNVEGSFGNGRGPRLILKSGSGDIKLGKL